MSCADVDAGPAGDPVCGHMDDPSCCDVICICGHPCKRHDSYDGWPDECMEKGCACMKYRDVFNPLPPDGFIA